MPAFMQAIQDYYVASTALVLGNVTLGQGVNIWFSSVVRGDVGTITLGSRVNLQDGCIAHTDTGESLTIEEGVVVGHGAILHGARIGQGSLIGMGARLLSGCDVGDHCVVAAGTVIPEGRRIPPRSVVMGIPGKVLRAVTDEEIDRTRRICAHYLELAQRHVRGDFPSPWVH